LSIPAVFNLAFRQKRGKAICAVSGMLDGVFGSGESRHVAAWNAVKVVDRSEEVEDDGTIVRRERERFVNELTLVFASGKSAILR
jgi:hypothetical protein